MDSTKEDIKPLLILFERFLPEFPVKRDDLLKLNASFVIQFYSHWFNKLTNCCQLLLGEVVDNCSLEIVNEISLFLFIQDLFHKIGLPYFSLCDFYRPSNRTRTTMKVCLNFLFYIEEILPKSQELVKFFKQKANEIRSTQERICDKKNKVSEATYRIGLLMEEFEKLNKEYNFEISIENSSSEGDIELDKDIEQLQKEFESLSSGVSLQEQQLSNLNEEIRRLEDQVVADDVEMCKKNLEQLEIKIKDDEYLISKNQLVLAEKYKELEHLNRLTFYVQDIDTSALDRVQEIDNLKQKLREIEFNEQDILGKNKIIEIRNQKIIEADLQFQKDMIEMEATLSNKKEMLKVLDAQLLEEKNTQKQLNTRYQTIEKMLDANETEFLKLQKDQDKLESEIKKCHQRIITSQNNMTSEFTNLFASLGL